MPTLMPTLQIYLQAKIDHEQQTETDRHTSRSLQYIELKKLPGCYVSPDRCLRPL